MLLRGPCLLFLEALPPVLDASQSYHFQLPTSFTFSALICEDLRPVSSCPLGFYDYYE
jgi:hypothetical protein